MKKQQAQYDQECKNGEEYRLMWRLLYEQQLSMAQAKWPCRFTGSTTIDSDGVKTERVRLIWNEGGFERRLEYWFKSAAKPLSNIV